MNLKEDDKTVWIVLPVMRHSRKGRTILTENTGGLTGNCDGEKSSMAEAEDLAEMPYNPIPNLDSNSDYTSVINLYREFYTLR